ncbi:CRISPR-associated endonuclease Cas1 [Rhodovulum sp. YEN HP10]|uniref:CRISPR-associated endonuclease Cas1 n=1 Tax=Rhodovulum sp. HP10 TaxID=3387397 RepID=UPI0039E08D74
MAVRRIDMLRRRGFCHVVEADIVRCFERIPHEPVLSSLAKTLAGRAGADRLVDLVALWLEHAAMFLETPGLGLAQGSPLSPLLSNLYLDRLDDALDRRDVAVVRFADDFVLLCRSREAAAKALTRAENLLEAHGLELHGDGTRIVDFDRGFEFLGHLFVRSLTLRALGDPDEDPLEAMRLAGAEEARAADAARAEAEESAAGYDRAERVLYLVTPGRRLGLRNLSFNVTGEEGRELLGIAPGRVDRIEIGARADFAPEALRQALATGIDVAFLDGRGQTEGWLSAGPPERADLHLAQARLVLDPVASAALARTIVEARLRNQRTKLRVLNRVPKDPEVAAACTALGRVISKLPGADTPAALRGHEGSGAAIYWPALGRLCAAAPQPFRRTRPATDPLNAAINWLTAMLERDIRAAIAHAGLHPGFGVLHVPADRSAACVWDLMEGYRSALTEGLAVTLFNQNRLRTGMMTSFPGGIRLGRDAIGALISGYEMAVGRLVTSPHSGRRRTWRWIMREEAQALARHMRDPEGMPFRPFLQTP